MKKLFIIDGNSLMNRAFYALPPLANSSGIYTNAVFGFLNCVIKLITENKPDYFVVAFDHSRHTFRTSMYDGYKATRKETPTELKSQFPLIREALDVIGIKYIEQEGIEADDIIGTIAKNSGLNNIIITGDKDSLQLVDQTTNVWLTLRGITNIQEVNLNNIKELFSLTPAQVIEFKALAGDSSDNIPGVNGIGDKTAISLLESYNNIDGIYENLENLKPSVKTKLENDKQMCYLSKTLATIKTDCDINYNIENFKFEYPFNSNVKEFFKKYNFSAFLKRDIFNNEIKSEALLETIKTKDQLKKVLSEFNGEYFALDFRNKFMFGFNGKGYVIEKEITLFDLEPLEIGYFIEQIMPILNNQNVVKIISDVKEHLHMLKIDNIPNVFDIKLANYLILGGNKLEQFIEITDFYNEYKNLNQKLKELNLEDLYFNLELPLVFVLYNMEIQGFKLDTQELNRLNLEYSRELNFIENEILKYTTNSNLNIKSSKQLSVFLFDELGLSDKFNKKHSTNVDVLNSLINEHPVIPLILRHRKVQKLNSTYIEPYIKLTGSSDIIHTIFNQMQTTTGRLSSSEPNLQNIPVRDEEGKVLRKMFVSSFENGKIISADYNQIELRLLANFSNDQNLVADYNSGIDIHRQTASQIFDINLNEVTDNHRRTAKAVNFGIIYGISAYGLSQNLDCSVKEAQGYIDKYFVKYPNVKLYLDGLIKEAKELGYAKTLFNRIRFIPELQSNNSFNRTFGERVAMNMPLQGSASDIIKLAMINVYNKMKELNLKSKLILQIHDELIIDATPDEEEIVKQILKTEMQNVYNFKVPLLVEVGSGNTWFDCK